MLHLQDVAALTERGLVRESAAAQRLSRKVDKYIGNLEKVLALSLHFFRPLFYRYLPAAAHEFEQGAARCRRPPRAAGDRQVILAFEFFISNNKSYTNTKRIIRYENWFFNSADNWFFLLFISLL